MALTFFEGIIFLAPILVPGYFAWKNLKTQIAATNNFSLQMFNLQKRKDDVQANIPVAVEILEDLGTLQQAFIYRGSFIPGLEPRCPTIQLRNGENENEISIAERTHQLHLIALRIIKNCRKIIFLTPEGMMPRTVTLCKQIRDSFLLKKPGQNRYFEIKISAIGTTLQNSLQQSAQSTKMHEENNCRLFAEELEKYQTEFELQIQEEFPNYAPLKT